MPPFALEMATSTTVDPVCSPTVIPPLGESPTCGSTMMRSMVVEDSETDRTTNAFEAYPEGGWKAYSVLFGAWCALLPPSGLLNSIGSLQAHLLSNQLKEYTESEVGWIFSVFAFLFFFGGLQAGPIFDSYGLKVLIIPGSFGFLASLIVLASCEEYYQFMLGFSVLGGLSASLIWTSTIATIGHWFSARRGLATGLATTAGGIGGIIFPILIQVLIPRVGYSWAIRIIAFMCLGFSSAALALMSTRLPLNTAKKARFDFQGFTDKRFTLTIAAIFVIDLAVLVPPSFITTYALAHGVDPAFSYQLLAILNAASVIGRGLPGIIADRWGRFNVMILSSLGCTLLILALWMFAGDSVVAITMFSILFGAFSGTAYSLTPVCVSQLCRTEDYGTRYGTAYGIVSFATLAGIPVSGLILGGNGGGNYRGLMWFCGVLYAVATGLFTLARASGSGWKLLKVY